MKTINKVELQGTTTRDAEQKSSKAPVRIFMMTGGEDRPNGGRYPVCYHTITCWVDKFPNAMSVRKGMPVRIIGHLHWANWKDKDGQERTWLEIVADQVVIDPQYVDGLGETKPPLTPDFAAQVKATEISEKDIDFLTNKG